MNTSPRDYVLGAVLGASLVGGGWLASSAIAAPSTTPTPVVTSTVQPSPCEPGSPHQDCVSRAQAEARIVAAGRSWDEFLTFTSDRPRYELVFIDLWLSS